MLPWVQTAFHSWAFALCRLKFLRLIRPAFLGGLEDLVVEFNKKYVRQSGSSARREREGAGPRNAFEPIEFRQTTENRGADSTSDVIAALQSRQGSQKNRRLRRAGDRSAPNE